MAVLTINIIQRYKSSGLMIKNAKHKPRKHFDQEQKWTTMFSLQNRQLPIRVSEKAKTKSINLIGYPGRYLSRKRHLAEEPNSANCAEAIKKRS